MRQQLRIWIFNTMFDIYLKKLLNDESLTSTEAQQAMNEIMTGKVSDIKLSAWLTALKLKGENADEICGCATSMNEHSIKVDSQDNACIDIVGTGGDGAKTFNISTAAAFVAAGAGVSVAKHGNRAVSSKSGAADVLTELGINIDIDAEIMEKCLQDIGISFLFAQKLHPAMKYAMPVRKELGTRTIFNILGPLSNPAKTQRMVIGVYSKHLCRLIAEATMQMGKEHILVVYGNDCLDEITTTTTTHICELKNGTISEYDFNPEEYGIPMAKIQDISGGTPKENAAIIRSVFSGKQKGPERDIILINAAAGIYVSGKANSWNAAIALANESLDSGNARKKLQGLIETTND
jgi:anthranilate phosphoribosyltransferase